MVDIPADALGPDGQANIEKGQQGLTPSDGGIPPAPPSGPQRPEWVPEKFWDAEKGEARYEDLAKSYVELEKARSAAAPAAPAQAPAEPPKAPADGKIEPPKEPAPGETPAPLAAAMEAARTEWAEKGEVSDDAVSALEAAGIPKAVFNLYLEGVKAQQAALLGELHGAVEGGAEGYNAMVQWAAGNLPADQIEAFNAAIDNPLLRQTAVKDLFGKYRAANPSEGKMITNTGNAGAAGDVFKSRDELVAAQKDPRYTSDPAYRQSVVEKLQRSQQVGFTAFDRPMFEREVFTR